MAIPQGMAFYYANTTGDGTATPSYIKLVANQWYASGGGLMIANGKTIKTIKGNNTAGRYGFIDNGIYSNGSYLPQNPIDISGHDIVVIYTSAGQQYGASYMFTLE